MNPTSAPKPPYYAVIFTSNLAHDDEEYHRTADKMVELAKQQVGFIGIESARSEMGITVSYWRDLASITQWKQNLQHLEAQSRGKSHWYSSYQVRIAKVEREYHFSQNGQK